MVEATHYMAFVIVLNFFMHKLIHIRSILIPASMTKTLSQSMTVGILWAMLIIVRSAKSSRIIFCITASVCESTDAVASSMNSILLRFSMILPKQRSCLCPTLQLSPPSTTKNSKVNKCQLILSPKEKRQKVLYQYFRIELLKGDLLEELRPEASSFSGFAATTSFSWQRSRLYSNK